MNPYQLEDVRQTKEYSSFMEKIGWQIKKIKKGSKTTYIYLKKLPFLPLSIVKILRCPWPIDYKKIKEKIKKDSPLIIKIQPFIIENQPPAVNKKPTTSKFLKKDPHPLIPTKTIWLDLKKSKSRLLKEMKQKTRYNLRLAGKRGIKVKIIAGNQVNQQQLKAFYQLWSKNKPFNWLFKPSFKELKALVNSFGKKSFLIFSYHRLILNSCLLILTSKNMAFYWHNASTKTGRKKFAPTLSLWQAVVEAKKKGLAVFDLEGIYDSRFCQAQKGWQGFSRFKKGFGGKKIKLSPPLKDSFLSSLLPSRTK